MTNEQEKDYTNLGYVNGWDETPEIVKQCRKSKHVTSVKTIGRCLHKEWCQTCKYYFKTDSSD